MQKPLNKYQYYMQAWTILRQKFQINKTTKTQLQRNLSRITNIF